VRSGSLTIRLALLLLAFSFVTLVLLGGSLYVALARQPRTANRPAAPA